MASKTVLYAMSAFREAEIKEAAHALDLDAQRRGRRLGGLAA